MANKPYPTMKKKLKARKLWANFYRKGCACHPTKRACNEAMRKDLIVATVPVAVIPLDDPEAIVVAAAAAHYKAWSGVGKPTNGDCMRAALTAIGVLPKARKNVRVSESAGEQPKP